MGSVGWGLSSAVSAEPASRGQGLAVGDLLDVAGATLPAGRDGCGRCMLSGLVAAHEAPPTLQPRGQLLLVGSPSSSASTARRKGGRTSERHVQA